MTPLAAFRLELNEDRVDEIIVDSERFAFESGWHPPLIRSQGRLVFWLHSDINAARRIHPGGSRSQGSAYGGHAVRRIALQLVHACCL
jgi:hypothetical protein